MSFLPKPDYKPQSLDMQIEEALRVAKNTREWDNSKEKHLRYARQYDIVRTLNWLKEHREAFLKYVAETEASNKEGGE